MDTKNTSYPSSSENLTVDAQKKKLWVTELVLNAVLAGLLVLSAIFSAFLPFGRFYDSRAKGVTANFSALDGTILLIDELKDDSENYILIQKFKENEGESLFIKDKDGEIRRKSPSEEQVLNDVAFKREHSFGKRAKLMNVFNFISDVRDALEDAYKPLYKYAGSDQNIIDIDEINRQKNEDYAAMTDAALALINLYPEEVENFNYAGLKRFLTYSHADYLNDSLTAEKVTDYEKKYLVGTYGEAGLVDYFGTDTEGTDTEMVNQHTEMVNQLIDYMPDYATDFKMMSDSTIILVDGKLSKDMPQFGLMSVGFGGFVILFIFALAQLIYAILVILRLLRVVRHQPRKVPQKKQKFKSKFVLSIISLLMIVGWILPLILGKAEILSCTFAPAFILIFILNALIIAADILYHRFVGQNTETAE